MADMPSLMDDLRRRMAGPATQPAPDATVLLDDLRQRMATSTVEAPTPEQLAALRPSPAPSAVAMTPDEMAAYGQMFQEAPPDPAPLPPPDMSALTDRPMDPSTAPRTSMGPLAPESDRLGTLERTWDMVTGEGPAELPHQNTLRQMLVPLAQTGVPIAQKMIEWLDSEKERAEQYEIENADRMTPGARAVEGAAGIGKIAGEIALGGPLVRGGRALGQAAPIAKGLLGHVGAATGMTGAMAPDIIARGDREGQDLGQTAKELAATEITNLLLPMGHTPARPGVVPYIAQQAKDLVTIPARMTGADVINKAAGLTETGLPEGQDGVGARTAEALRQAPETFFQNAASLALFNAVMKGSRKAASLLAKKPTETITRSEMEAADVKARLSAQERQAVVAEVRQALQDVTAKAQRLSEKAAQMQPPEQARGAPEPALPKLTTTAEPAIPETGAKSPQKEVSNVSSRSGVADVQVADVASGAGRPGVGGLAGSRGPGGDGGRLPDRPAEPRRGAAEAEPPAAEVGTAPWLKTRREYEAQGRIALPETHPLREAAWKAQRRLEAAINAVMANAPKYRAKTLQERRSELGAALEGLSKPFEQAIKSPKIPRQVRAEYDAAKSEWLAAAERVDVAVDHRTLVEQALREGKPVPAEVLADYPDLQRPPVEAEKRTETALESTIDPRSVSQVGSEGDRGSQRPEVGVQGAKQEASEGEGVPSPEMQRTLRHASERARKLKAQEAENAFESLRQRIVRATDKDPIASEFSREQAQRFLEYMDAAPGDDPKARAAIYRVYPDLGAAARQEAPAGEGFSWKYESPAPRRQADPATVEAETNQPSRQVVELPELVDFAKQINQGKIPFIKERMGRVLGRARFQGAEADIALRADIFIGPEIQTVRVRPEKATEAVGELKADVLARHPELTEDLIEIRQGKDAKSGQTRITAYLRDPSFANRVLGHEIGHVDDWLPDKERARGNILGHIAALKRYMKDMLAASPTSTGQMLDKKDRQALRKRAAGIVRADVGRKEMGTPEAREAVKGVYRQLLAEEAQARGLHSKAAIMAELKDLTRWWSPFDPEANPQYTKYRHRPSELFAEAVSVWLNQPGELQRRAPQFLEAFEAYMDARPEVAKTYDRIQALIDKGQVADKRDRAEYEAHTEGNRKLLDYLTPDRPTVRDRLRAAANAVRTGFSDQRSIAMDVGKGNRKLGVAPNFQLRDALQKLSYIESNDALREMEFDARIRKPMSEAGLKLEDLDALLFHRRIVSTETMRANPRGINEKASREALQRLEQRLGPRKWGALQEAHQGFVAMHRQVVEALAEARMHSPELIQTLQENVDTYATFMNQKYLDRQYGSGVSGKVFGRVGTFSDIAGPTLATFVKDAAMIRSMRWNDAKRLVIENLEANQKEPAKKRWSGRYMEFVEPTDPRKRLVVYLQDGKPQGHYVPKDLGEALNLPEHSTAFRAVAHAAHALAMPARTMFVLVRPRFWKYNPIRDFQRNVTYLPGMKPGISAVTHLPRWLASIPEAIRTAKGKPGEAGKFLLREGVIGGRGDLRGMATADRQFSRMVERMAQDPGLYEKHVRRPLHKLWEGLTFPGQVGEITSKVAGYRHLKAKFPEMTDAEVAYRVRNQAGSPPFQVRGEFSPITNNIVLFSNVAIGGWRTSLERAREAPMAVGTNIVAHGIVPGVLKAAITSGAVVAALEWAGLTDDDELMRWAKWTRDVYRKASEYMRSNYILIPLGYTPQGKGVLWRIPQEESLRLVGAVAYKAAMATEHGPESWGQILDYTAQQFPSTNPILDVIPNTIAFAGGKNPYDDWRGRYALPEDVFKAGGWRARLAFAKWQAEQIGLGGYYRFRSDDQAAVESEIEKAIGWPVLGDFIGGSILVTDAGESETYREAAGDVQQEQAEEILLARDAARKRRQGLTLTDAEKRAAKLHPDAYRNALRRQQADTPYERAMDRAHTRREKVAVHRKAQELRQ